MRGKANFTLIVANRVDDLYEKYPINTHTWIPPQFPIGAASIGAFLESQGFDVTIFDNYLHKEPPEVVAEKILANRPSCVGISVNSLTILDGLKLAKEIKRLEPGCWIVMGGPHATLFPERTLADENVDYVVVGEGEYALRDLLRSLDGPARPGEGKKIIRAQRIDNLDDLPMPARHLTEFELYDRSFEVVKQIQPADMLASSRGCPFSCSFCSSSRLWGRQYRTRSALRVLEEVKTLLSVYDSKAFYFREDNFTCNRQHVEDICNALIAEGINIPWECESRVDTLDLKLIRLMRKAGCASIWFGIESGSQRILNKISKGITTDQARRVFAWCREEGIKTGAMFMIGFPDETYEEMMMTRDFALELAPNLASVSVYVGYPHSPLYQYYLENGLVETRSGDILIVGNNNFSFAELAKIEADINKIFSQAGML
ncbi:MAG: hypothetical protein DRH17_02535 [Deltaproteobacteria bacterium]|nr:MAG: hypothetical protein DRH17_02535 [Deltaproteobacteria bacterium]